MIDKVSKNDWQYLIPFLIIAFAFIGTDLLGLLNKNYLAYSSGILFAQPYRAVTTHFIHADFNHLLANTFGIVVARYFFKQLNLKSNYFFLILLCFLIPSQILLQWSVDVFLLKQTSSYLIGFSGLLYGVDGFLLMSSIYSKSRFLYSDIELSKNYKVFKAMVALIVIGLLFSFLPNISFSAHITGFVAGVILFFF